MDPDFHRPCPGQTQTICDLYIDLLRGVIEHQERLIADLRRRMAGEPITRTWIDGVLQPTRGAPVGSMLDLPAALRAAGLTVWVAPDWKTNGHDYDLIQPFGGVLHHTAGLGLRAVYGEPDARPDVPQPRCNVWTPRPGTQPYDIAVVSAGRAWQAGAGHKAAYDDLKAGRFTVKTGDAAARFGPNSDDIDAGWTSQHTLGNEVEWVSGEFPPAQLDVVAATMRVCVDLFNWPGLGCWAHHRQLTYRKPDMAYRGDIWTRARNITIGKDWFDMASLDDLAAAVRGVFHLPDTGLAVPAGQLHNGQLAVNLTSMAQQGVNADRAVAAAIAAVKADTSLQGDDEAKILAKLADVQAAVSELSPAAPTPAPGT